MGNQQQGALCAVRVATDSDFAEHTAASSAGLLADWSKVSMVFQLSPSTSLSEILFLVTCQMGEAPAPDHQRFWAWAQHPDGSYRPDAPIEEDVAIEDLIRPGSQPPVVDLFFETVPPGPPLPPFKPSSDVLLFLKLYSGSGAGATLQYAGHMAAGGTAQIKSLLPQMRRVAGLPDGKGAPELEVSVEISGAPPALTKLAPSSTLKAAKLTNGSILVLAPPGAKPTPEELYSRPAGGSSQQQQSAAPSPQEPGGERGAAAALPAAQRIAALMQQAAQEAERALQEAAEDASAQRQAAQAAEAARAAAAAEAASARREAQERAAELEGRVKNAESAAAAAREEAAGAREQLAAREAELAELHGTKLKALEGQLAAAAAAAATATEAAAAHCGKLADAEEEAGRLRDAATAALAAAEERGERVGTLEAQLRQVIQEAENALEHAAAEAAELRRQLQSREQESREELDREVEAREQLAAGRIKALEAQLAAATEEAEQLRGEVAGREQRATSRIKAMEAGQQLITRRLLVLEGDEEACRALSSGGLRSLLGSLEASAARVRQLLNERWQHEQEQQQQQQLTQG